MVFLSKAAPRTVKPGLDFLAVLKSNTILLRLLMTYKYLAFIQPRLLEQCALRPPFPLHVERREQLPALVHLRYGPESMCRASLRAANATVRSALAVPLQTLRQVLRKERGRARKLTSNSSIARLRQGKLQRPQREIRSLSTSWVD